MGTQLETLRGSVTVEHLRIAWTVLGAVGALAFVVLINEARRDHRAVLRMRPARLSASAMQTWGDVQDHAMLMLALACMAAAGMLSMIGPSVATVALLVTSECLLVALGGLKLLRRRRLLRVLRVDRKQ